MSASILSSVVSKYYRRGEAASGKQVLELSTEDDFNYLMIAVT